MPAIITVEFGLDQKTPGRKCRPNLSDQRRPAAPCRVVATSVCLLILVLSSSCAEIASPTGAPDDCATAPAFQDTARTLLACLPSAATAADAERLLGAWRRLGGNLGGASQADVLPGGGEELIVRYHADLDTASWNPQGKFLVLQRAGQGWQPAFEGTQVRVSLRDGTPWDNWSYHILALQDVTGDGLADILMNMIYSNGLHLGLEHVVLLTAHPGTEGSTLHLAYDDDTTLTRPAFTVLSRENKPAIQAVIAPAQTPAITRILAFTGQGLTEVGEEIHIAASTAAAVTSDGAHWYAFDQSDGVGGSSMYSPALGIYRLQDGRLAHFAMPAIVKTLRTGPDGSLYATVGLGVLRYAQQSGKWETLVSPQGEPHLSNEPFVPFDLAFGQQGDLWVSGIFSLAHFDERHGWTQYKVPARRVLVAPDGSVWADGWDGHADSDCCFTHVTGTTAVTYTHTAVLTVPADLRARIEDLRH